MRASGRIWTVVALGAVLALTSLRGCGDASTPGRSSSPSWETSATGPAAPAAESNCDDKFLASARPSIPTSQAAGGIELCSQGYASFNSIKTRTPLWSAERLTPDSVAAARNTERLSEFRADERLPRDGRAELADYRRSGYDRGHLSPSGDMPDLASQQESFLLSNIVPQAAALNRGDWADLESAVRRAASSAGAYVVTGVLFQGRYISTTPDGRVLIPTSIWKAVAIPGTGATVYVATNADESAWKTETVKEFSAETGIDPFPALGGGDRTRQIRLR